MRFSTSIAALLALVSFVGVTEGRLLFGKLGLFGGSDEEEDPSTTVPRPQGAGVFISDTELQAGRRGLACLQYLANVENDPYGEIATSLIIRPVSRVLLQFYGEEGLNKICQSTRRGRALLGHATVEEESESHATGSNNVSSNHHQSSESVSREMQSCGAQMATYPADPANDPNEVYADYAEKYLDMYLPNGDRTQRSDNAFVLEKVNQDLNYFRDVRAALAGCMTIWDGVNQIVALIDIPVIDQDKISEAIMSFSCGLSNTYNDIVISRNERYLERIQFHDHVIDGSEIGSTYSNTRTMMNNLCVLRNSVESAKAEVEIIKEGAKRF